MQGVQGLQLTAKGFIEKVDSWVLVIIQMDQVQSLDKALYDVSEMREDNKKT